MYSTLKWFRTPGALSVSQLPHPRSRGRVTELPTPPSVRGHRSPTPCFVPSLSPFPAPCLRLSPEFLSLPLVIGLISDPFQFPPPPPSSPVSYGSSGRPSPCLLDPQPQGTIPSPVPTPSPYRIPPVLEDPGSTEENGTERAKTTVTVGPKASVTSLCPSTPLLSSSEGSTTKEPGVGGRVWGDMDTVISYSLSSQNR